MKRFNIILLAAASVFAAASCAKAVLEEPVAAVSGETTTLTLTLESTKSALVNGKTTWLAGDLIRIYSSAGSFYQDVAVPEAQAGKASVDLEVKMADTKYFAVYPVEAANGIASGKPSIKLSANPDGRFASANVCVAETADGGTTLAMKNATAVLKVTVESKNTVEILQVNAQNAMTGTYTVDLSGEAPVLTATAGAKSATVATGGVDGDYFIAVAPGTYAAEFSVTALKGNGGYQTLTSTKANEVTVNTILSLGKIGDNLTNGLPGEGTETNPYKITNLGEWTAFSASVNLGSTYAGKFISLDTDIEEAVKTPVGYYVSADVQFPFSGTFIGNSHTVALDIDGANNKNPNNYTALFGLVGEGATLKNVKVKGTVVSTGNYTGGLVAYTRGASSQKALIENCESSAVVTGNTTAAGITAYACYTDVKNCTNTGAVAAGINAAGIVGYNYYNTIDACKNTAEISVTKDGGRVLILPTGSHQMSYLDGSSTTSYSTISTLGVGGIAAWSQNADINNCNNSGNIKGVSKAGGISGALYWANTKGNTNSGNVTVTTDIAGGIVGWTYTNSNCTDDVNSGVISGRAAIGGIAGMLNAGISNGIVAVRGCKNSGKVESNVAGGSSKHYNYGFANLSAAGGIVGMAAEYLNGTGNRCAQISACENTGAVSGVGQAVGGILGFRECPLNGTRNGYVDKCVNKGTVESALYRAGGIVGVCFDRFTSGVFTIRNCENHGTVKAPYVVAGIAGWISTAYPAASTGYFETIYNCLNDGDVLYNKTAYADTKGPYAGGIAGYTQQVRIQNVYNSGAVKPAEGDPNDFDAKLRGNVISYIGKTSEVNNLYALKVEGLELYGSVKGTGPEPTIGDVTGQVLASTGEFESIVTIGEKTYEKPHEALNAWVGTSTTYYLWKAGSKGPEFDVK